MRVDELLAIVTRRWRVVLLGVVLTALVGWAAVATTEPVYWVQSDELFIAPGATPSGAVDDSTRDAMISFAGTVEREVNAGEPAVRYSSASATLYGAGVRQGHSVVLPDAGGQWESSFNRPVLSVQVVDSSPEAVRARLADVRDEIRTVAAELQAVNGVPEDARISVVSVPDEPDVAYVGSSFGGRVRGLVAVACVGAVLTALAAVAVDRRSQRRQIHPARRGVETDVAA